MELLHNMNWSWQHQDFFVQIRIKIQKSKKIVGFHIIPRIIQGYETTENMVIPFNS